MAMDRTDHDYGDDIPRVSPRFGIELTAEMGSALARALEHFDSWEDDPVEVVEIAVRQELGLAHTLSYNIEPHWPGSSGISISFARVGAVWESGFVNPEAWQFQHCEAEMRRLHDGRDGAWDHNAIIDDSDIYEPKPWAIPYVLKLWDRKIPFHSFLAVISAMDPESRVSVYELEPDQAEHLSRVTKELRSHIVSSDEHEDMQVVIELAADREMPAQDVLEFFADY
jgi:hypothetical protein